MSFACKPLSLTTQELTHVCLFELSCNCQSSLWDSRLSWQRLCAKIRCPAVIDHCRLFHRLMSNVACHLFNAACWLPNFSSHCGSVSPVQFIHVVGVGLQASQSCESPCVGCPMLEHVQMCRKLTDYDIFFLARQMVIAGPAIVFYWGPASAKNLAWPRRVAMHFRFCDC